MRTHETVTIRTRVSGDIEIPDYAALYAEHELMTPRLAFYLSTQLSVYADVFGDCPDLWAHHFPPAARPFFEYDDAWRARFSDEMRSLADEIDAGKTPVPDSVAADFALRLAIDFTAAQAPLTGDGDIADAFATWYAHLPEHVDRDEDFDLLYFKLFGDEDGLFLFDPVHPDSILHPSNWFLRR